MRRSLGLEKRTTNRSLHADSRKRLKLLKSSLAEMTGGCCGFRIIAATPEMKEKMQQGVFDCQELLEAAEIESGQMACVVVPVQAAGIGKLRKK